MAMAVAAQTTMEAFLARKSRLMAPDARSEALSELVRQREFYVRAISEEYELPDAGQTSHRRALDISLQTINREIRRLAVA